MVSYSPNIARQKPISFNWEDPFLLEDQLTEEERMIRDTAKAYCQDNFCQELLKPTAMKYFT